MSISASVSAFMVIFFKFIADTEPFAVLIVPPLPTTSLLPSADKNASSFTLNSLSFIFHNVFFAMSFKFALVSRKTTLTFSTLLNDVSLPLTSILLFPPSAPFIAPATLIVLVPALNLTSAFLM